VDKTDSDSGHDPVPRPRRLFGLVDSFLEIWDSTERLAAVVAGLFLAGIFWMMPLLPLGSDEPWYFWVGSGFVALAASVLLAYVYFPHGTSSKGGPTHDDPESDDT